jgi:hypothetical protein
MLLLFNRPVPHYERTCVCVLCVMTMMCDDDDDVWWWWWGVCDGFVRFLDFVSHYECY